MKNNILVVLLAILMIHLTGCSEDDTKEEPPITNDIEWTREFRIPDQGARFEAIEQTIDDDYIIFGRGAFNPFIMKLNDVGETLWTKTYSQYTIAINHPVFRKVDDLHYAFNHNYGLAIIDTSGSVIQEIELNQYVCYNFGLTPEKGYILFCREDDELTYRIYNSSGILEETQPSDDYFNDVDQESNLNFYCIYNYSDPSYPGKVCKMDSYGNELWAVNEFGRLIHVAADGNILIAQASALPDEYGVWGKGLRLRVLDSVGSLLNQRVFDDGVQYYVGQHIRSTAKGYLIAYFTTQTFTNSTSTNIRVKYFDHELNEIATRNYGRTAIVTTDWLRSFGFTVTSDEGYIIANQSEYSITGKWSNFIITKVGP